MDDDPTGRALELLALFQSGRAWTAADLGARLGVTERTVRRDVRRLRELGYGIDGRPGPGSTYRLGPGRRVPPMLFTADEVSAIVAALRLMELWTAADPTVATALTKLEQVLPPALRRRAAATGEATAVLGGVEAAVPAATLGTVAEAVATGDDLGFNYEDGRGRRSRRRVQPYRLVLTVRAWYLVAFDLDRNDWRLYRLDRVTAVEPAPGTPRHEFPHDDLARWLTTDFDRRPALP